MHVAGLSLPLVFAAGFVSFISPCVLPLVPDILTVAKGINSGYVGLGLFWGLELVRNRETREPLVPFNAGGEAAAPVGRVVKAALERGLYLFVHWNVVIIAPPLNITREELDEGFGILDEVLALADEYA